MDFLGKILSADDLINKQYVDEAIPTSLPASDVYAWAKAATKPSYTKAEVGLGNVENKSSATIRGEITATNVTNALGYTPANNASLANYLPLSGGALTNNSYSTVLCLSGASSSLIEFQQKGTKLGAIGYNSNGVPVAMTGASYVNLIHSGNYSDYALPLRGGTIESSSSSSPLIIKTSSNAWLMFRNASGYLGEYGYSYDKIAKCTDASGATKIVIHDGNIGSQYVAGLIKSDGNAYVSYNATYGYANINGVAIGLNSNTIERVTSGKLYIQKNVTEATIINQYGGNVGVGMDNPAYKLDVNGKIRFEARTIWGQSFDGTGNVSGNILGGTKLFTIYGYDDSGNTNIIDCSGVNKQLWIGYGSAAKSYDTELAGNNIHFHYGTSRTNGLILNSSGNVGIGTTSPAYKLDVNGNTRIAGNAIITGDTATGSDIRFKDKITDHRIALSDIAEAPLFTFKWNDREDKTVHLGSSAQYWEGVAPWLVKGTDFKVLDYSTLGVAIGISLANKTLNLEDRVKILEKENKALKEQIRRINYGS